MEKEFIPYEQALELKELGFDEECFGEYFQIGHHFGQLVTSNEELDIQLTSIFECGAPLYQQSFRWFREKHGFAITITTYCKEFIQNMDDVVPKQYNYHITNSIVYDAHYQDYYDSYEEAELECLKKLIELVKELK